MYKNSEAFRPMRDDSNDAMQYQIFQYIPLKSRYDFSINLISSGFIAMFADDAKLQDLTS